MDSTGGIAALGIVMVLGIIAVSLASFVFWIWSIVDAARYTEAQYQKAGQSKVVWIVVIVLVGALGSLLYLLIARPRLAQP